MGTRGDEGQGVKGPGVNQSSGACEERWCSASSKTKKGKNSTKARGRKKSAVNDSPGMYVLRGTFKSDLVHEGV